MKSIKEQINSSKPSQEIVSELTENFDRVIKNTYLDFRQDFSMNHREAVDATARELKTDETDIEDTLARLNVDTR